MSELPKLTAKEAEKHLLHAGFKLSRQKGSHRIYRNGSSRIVLPWHQGKMLHPEIIKELFDVIEQHKESALHS